VINHGTFMVTNVLKFLLQNIFGCCCWTADYELKFRCMKSLHWFYMAFISLNSS